MMTDIYAAADEIEAGRIVAFLLAEGIHATRDTEIAAPPYPSALDRRLVSVLEEQKESAVAKIKEARRDAVISSQGAFL